MTGPETCPDEPLPPTPADEAAWRALADGALPAVQKMAVAWRTGLAGLVTLVTTGVVVTGRTTAAGLTLPWRAAVTIAVGGGLGMAIIGLWHALAAEAGATTRPRSREEVLARHGSIHAYQVALAVLAADRLRQARRMVATALALLTAGVLLTWWAPLAPPAYLQVTHTSGDTTCGRLTSADGGILRLDVTGSHEPATIPMTNVMNMTIAAACP